MPATDQTPFNQALSRLNAAQKQAVEQTEGPLLVIAGPGTGKTQLLSARVAYILQQTDALPQNILCLTFTESGAQNMRDRLTSFIGQAAYDVTIGTYHAFGGELIGRFPQYFGEHRAQQAADGLAQRQIIQEIVEKLPHRHPLKSTQHHLHDLLSTISEIKRGLLTEDELRAITEDNLHFLEDANKELREIFADFTSMTAKFEIVLPFFDNLHNYLSGLDRLDYKLATAGPLQVGSLAGVIKHSLESALAQAEDEHSKKPLTAWKNQWLVKDSDNNLAFDGVRQNQRIMGIADVLRDYTQALQDRGLYDFDDMILRSIKALQQHDDLRFTLQEQYQYIMLDEFQDTNAAQLELISQLTNNPVTEGRPNVMAVGDDDQAIYAFQGAEVSNMLAFAQAYRDTSVINLTENYRSHPEILHVAHQVAGQINERLSDSFPDMSKILVAANKDIAPSAHIDRHEFQSDVAQYDWLAEQIAQLIKSGVPAQEIAVLAPRHKQLEPLVAFLNQRDIPVRYEKRENILQAPVVQQLLTIAKLVLALATGQEKIANGLWPEVLSYNFWQLPTSAIWQLSWRIRNSSSSEESGRLTWSQAVLQDEHFRAAGLLILSLAQRASTESLEVMLDAIIGNEPVVTHEADLPTVHSPLRTFYMGDALKQAGQDPQQGNASADLFYQTMSHLTCLREKLRDHQNSQEDVLKLADLLLLVQLYEDAGERMLNTSPYNQHAEAVQLMTVFKAKGLEFEHVFLPSVQDDVWGNSSRAQSNRLTLPPNLLAIRPAGTTEDERLRIFFVAITRAKLGLHLTSFTQSYSGRATKRLKYLNEQQTGDGFKTLILPAEVQDVRHIDHEVPQLSTLELNWRQRHLNELDDAASGSNLRDLLQSKLERFQLSPTMVTGFSDLLYGGPQDFFFKHILQFPQAAGAEADYGTAIHETLQWYQQQLDSTGQAPSPQAAIAYYDSHMARKHLLPEVSQQLKARGEYILQHYLAARGSHFKAGNNAEHNFRNENVWVGPAHMSGKIDLMEIDRKNKTITIVDYKTGKAYDRWSSDAKLHKYRHQLICYKLLVEGSRSFKEYRVAAARLEFVEPDENNKIHSLELHFDDPKVKQDVERTSQLIQAVWQHAKALDFPDTSGYDQSLTGIKQFETDLLT